MMQRVLLLISTLFALYACTSTVPQPAQAPLPGAQAIEQPAASAVSEVPVAPSVIETVPESVVLPNITPFPHIALLLPVQSDIFGPAADAAQQGFFAAAKYSKRQILPVRVYSDFDENTSVQG
jgi:outer membrane PBP1 activator LpoA protein